MLSNSKMFAVFDGAGASLPGGWIADHYGRRRALTLFISLAAVGYAIYWLAPSWPFVFAGLVFVMAWTSMASPTLFAVVGAFGTITAWVVVRIPDDYFVRGKRPLPLEGRPRADRSTS